MSTEKKEKKTKSKDRVEKKHKKDKKEKKSSKSKKKEHRVAEAAFSLLASDNAVNPALSSLFAVQVYTLPQ